MNSSAPPPQLLWRVASVYVVRSHNVGRQGNNRDPPVLFCLSEQVTVLWEGG